MTALAQLCTLRTQTARSLISVFDQSYQYIIAESNSTFPLKAGLAHDEHDEELWLCGSAIPRSHGVCEYAVCGDDVDQLNDLASDENPMVLPLTKIDDLGKSPRFSAKPYCKPGSPSKFFAAVPVRTRRGINIGVLAVIHDKPVTWWTDEHTQVLRDVSDLVMTHLEMLRTRILHRCSERMNDGFRSFLENQSTLTGRRDNIVPSAYLDKPGMEGSLNTEQQFTLSNQSALETHRQLSPAEDAAHQLHSPSSLDSQSSYADGSMPILDGRLPLSRPSPARDAGSVDLSQNQYRRTAADTVFGRAANIIRESLEVEGCLFVDPTSAVFGSLASDSVKKDSDASGAASSSVDSSGDRNEGVR